MQDGYLFKGVGVALVTLFHEDGSLDAPATAELAGNLVDAGVAAVVVAGTTGEAASLDGDERSELLNAVRKVVPEGSGTPLIVGTGTCTTSDSVCFTRAAREAGADAVLTMALPSAPDQRPYYTAIAEAAGDMPVLGYHYPKVSSPGIGLDQLADLPIAGLKDSSGDAGRLVQTLDQWGGPLYSGSANLIFMAGALGCAGMILGLANVEPEKCAAAFNGDPAAQLVLAKAIKESEVQFPATLKQLVSARFGTSTITRLK